MMTKRIADSAAVIREVARAADKGIPVSHLGSRTYCIVVLPGGQEAAFVFGGEYGKVSLSPAGRPAAGVLRDRP
jgi:lipid-binding SYLF domain-containing protein